MAIRLGDLAPNFTAQTTEGEIDFHQWLGNGWGILFSHPRDYTPVCTTELGTASKMKAEFDQRGVKVIAVSIDPIDDHHGWICDINETQGTKMNFPIIADPTRNVANLYDMIHPNADDTATVRSNFVPVASSSGRRSALARVRPSMMADSRLVRVDASVRPVNAP